MKIIFFAIMVVLLGGILGISALNAHVQPIGRKTAGWWAGIFLSIIFLVVSLDQFEKLPSRSVRGSCGSYETEIDWATVAEESIRLDIISVVIGLVLAIAAFEMLERLELSGKVAALLLLFLALTSSFALIYIFAIRKLTYYIFSLLMGGMIGFAFQRAFLTGEEDE